MQARASIWEMRLLELYVIAMGLLLPGQPRVDEALAIPDRPVAYQVLDAFQTLIPCLDLIEALPMANAKSLGGTEADFESRTAHEHLFNLCAHLQRSRHAWPFRPPADKATEPRGCVSLLLSAVDPPVTILLSVVPELRDRIDATKLRRQTDNIRSTTFFVDDVGHRPWSSNRFFVALGRLRAELAGGSRCAFCAIRASPRFTTPAACASRYAPSLILRSPASTRCLITIRSRRPIIRPALP